MKISKSARLHFLYVLLLSTIYAMAGAAHILESKRAEMFLPPGEVDPVAITGPDRLCNVFGSIIGTFLGGGDPANDVYSWKIIGPSSEELFVGTGGAGFQTIKYTFSIIGTHQVELKVTRGGISIGSFSKKVEVVSGPVIALSPSYQKCGSQDILISAIDPLSQNFPNYVFEWKDASGGLIGNSNTLAVSTPGQYEVTFYFINSVGNPECSTTLSTTISVLDTFQVLPVSATLCADQSILYSTDPETYGDWYLEKIGVTGLTPLAKGTSLLLNSSQLPEGFGPYRIIVKTDNPSNPVCSPEASADLNFNVEPQIEFVSATGATDCKASDGLLELRALTAIDLLVVTDRGISLGPLIAGEVFEIPGLESGAYTMAAYLNGCEETFGTVVPLVNAPIELDYSIENVLGESCTPTGKAQGSFTVKLTNGSIVGSYLIINEKGEEVLKSALPTADEFQLNLSGGNYYFQVLDQDSCKAPRKDKIEIPIKDQVQFFVPEKLAVCQSLDFTPQTIQALEFTMTAPDGSVETKPAGENFTLNKVGDYTFLGILPNQTDLCPREGRINVSIISPVDFQPKLINQDCFGNMTYEADIFGRDPATVVFRWYNENADLIGNGQFLNPVSYGQFKLDVQPANSESCPIPPIEFEIKRPILSVDVALESTKLCEYGPRALVDLTTTFPEEITHIEWRRYDDMGNIEPLPQFNNQWQITADIAGIYEVAVFSRIPSINKDCELGRQTLDIDLIPDKVPFDVPSDLFICDPFLLVPESATPLEFEMTFPDGKVEVKDWNEAFILDQEGTYTLLGYDPNIKGPLCPDEKTIQVKVFEPVQFSPKLVDMSCTGEYHYTADVINYPPDEVDYFWRDPSGNVVSSTSDLFSTTYGVFTLEIQPTGSIPCTISPASFILEVPVLSVPASIAAETLCPDQPDAALRLETNFDLVATIEWWFTDLSSNESMLSAETGKREILATNEGTYQVRIFNEFGCLLGSDETFVARSTDALRPKLEESYQVCPKYQIAPTLNPGSFVQYEWYFEDNLVSTNPTFKPLQIGTYYLIVVSQEGCAYETSFETAEECDLEVVFPNAIQPGNPNKQFLAYANFLVDELEIWVFNKWGNLIFHCFHVNSVPGESACYWDGTFDGKAIPPGSYAVRINSRNMEKNLKNEQWEAVLVID